MKATHVGNLDGKRLYYIFEEPPSKGNNGAMVAADGQVDYFPFWSFVSRKTNVEQLTINAFQKFLWKGSTGSMANMWNGVFVEELIPVPKDMVSGIQVVTEFPNPAKEKVREKDLRGSDFRRLLNSGNGDAFAFKRLRGTIGRATRLATGGTRGFVRGAVFDPNAEDADGDGFVQEGTQFARPATARIQRAERGFASGIGGNPFLSGMGNISFGRSGYKPKKIKDIPDSPDRPDKSKTVSVPRSKWGNLKWRRNSKRQKKAIDKLVKSVEEKVGPLRTRADAHNAWQTLFPRADISRLGLGPNDSTPLSPEEIGMYYGYLSGLLLQQNSLKDTRLIVQYETNPDNRGSVGYKNPVNVEENRAYTPTLIVSIKPAPVDNRDDGQRALDVVDSQIVASMARDSDGLDFPSDSEISRATSSPRDRWNFIANMIVGLHETGHIAHNIAAYKDIGRYGKTTDEILKDLIKKIKDPSIYGDFADKRVSQIVFNAFSHHGSIVRDAVGRIVQAGRGRGASDAEILKESQDFVSGITQNPSGPINEVMSSIRAIQDSGILGRLTRDNPTAHELLMRLEGDEPEDIKDLLEKLKDDINIAGRTLSVAYGTRLHYAATSPTASNVMRLPSTPNTPLVDVDEMLDDLIESLEDTKKYALEAFNAIMSDKKATPEIKERAVKLFIGASVVPKENPTDEFGRPVTMLENESLPLDSSFRLIQPLIINALKNSRHMREFHREVTSKFRDFDVDEAMKAGPGTPEYDMLLVLAGELGLEELNAAGRDDLSQQEIFDIWDIARQISDYGSYDLASWYEGRTAGQVPTEMIAEMFPALLIDPEDYFQKLSSQQTKSLLKLLKWLYGDEMAKSFMDEISPPPAPKQTESPKAND